jgi:hypothetical protein
MYDMCIPDLSYWEVASGSVFFQFSLYIAVRLAHRGFTLGELGLVVFGATALFIELVNLTVARVRIASENSFTILMLTPLSNSHDIDMARDDALHQNVSLTHTVAYLSFSPHSGVAVDGLSAVAFTHTFPAYRAATRATSAIPAGEAGTPACTRSWFLSRCGPHRRWADWHMDTVALAWA